MTSTAQRFGHYRVIEQIGEGGMGKVYLAQQEGGGLDRLAVVKSVRGPLLEDPEVIERFMQEARVNARLVHPNIVQIYELGEAEGVPYVVMEHVHGRAFDHVIQAAQKRGERVPLPVALRICCDVLRALDFAHGYVDELGRAVRVIHRDIKPGNVLIGFDGRVKLIDFGLAKTTTSTLKTSTGIIRGTLAYMSPEQAQSRPVDERSDLFAVGAMLFELCEGHAPFDRGEVLPTLRAIVDDPTPPLGGGLPERLRFVIEQLLAKNREERFDSASAALQALSACGEIAGDQALRDYLVMLFGRASRRKLPTAELERARRESGLAVVDTASSGPTIKHVVSSSPGVEIDELGETVAPDGAVMASQVEAALHAQQRAALSKTVAQVSPLTQTARLSRGRAPLVIVAVCALTGLGGLGYWLATRGGGASATGDGRVVAKLPVTRVDARAHAGSAAAKPAAPDGSAATRPPLDLGATAGTRAGSTPPGPRRPTKGQRRKPRRPARKIGKTPKTRKEPKTTDPIKTVAGTAIGRLTVNSTPRAIGVGEHKVTNSRGKVLLRGAFNVTLRYSVSGGRLLCSIDATPFAIVYSPGMTPGRTPRHGISVDRQGRRLELKNPAGASMVVVLRFASAR